MPVKLEVVAKDKTAKDKTLTVECPYCAAVLVSTGAPLSIVKCPVCSSSLLTCAWCKHAVSRKDSALNTTRYGTPCHGCNTGDSRFEPAPRSMFVCVQSSPDLEES